MMQRHSHIIFYRSGPERIRHAFGVHVLPEMHHATQLRVQTVDRVAPERQNVSLAQNARHVSMCPIPSVQRIKREWCFFFVFRSQGISTFGVSCLPSRCPTRCQSRGRH